MFQLKNQFKIISLLFFLLGILFIVNNQIYASPGIDLNARKNQLEEEIVDLEMELSAVHRNDSLTHESRLIQIRSILNALIPLRNELLSIHRQIIQRNQYNQQRRHNQDQLNNQNNPRR